MSVGIIIVERKISGDELVRLCKRWFGDMVKIVVDIEERVIAIGGDLHADAEKLLIEKGYRQENIWGANLYPWHEPDSRIEYTALINIRPNQDNPGMDIVDNSVKKKVKDIVETLIISPDENLV